MSFSGCASACPELCERTGGGIARGKEKKKREIAKERSARVLKRDERSMLADDLRHGNSKTALNSRLDDPVLSD